MSDAELIQSYLAGIREWAKSMGTAYQDQIVREAQEHPPLVDGLRAVYHAGYSDKHAEVLGQEN